MKKLNVAWGAAAREALFDADGITRGDDDARLRLHDLRGKEEVARKALGDAIARELADLDDGPA